MAKHTVYFLSSKQHRSLMAEIWTHQLELHDWDIKSAAWEKPSITETPIEILKEVLIQLPDYEPRQYNPEEVNNADLIVALYDGDIQRQSVPPDLSSQRVIHWNIQDPEQHATDSHDRWAAYQEVCDEIAMQVKEMEPLFRSI